MEHITSRKNKTIAHLRALGADRAYRRKMGYYLCDGEKLLREALLCRVEIEWVLWNEKPLFNLENEKIAQLTAPKELIEYVSPMKNAPGPIFSVRMSETTVIAPLQGAIVLENLQDPGNVGTILRTAGAMDIGVVLLLGDCADAYNPKTVRASMGAIFRQPFLETDFEGLREFLEKNSLRLFGAALSDKAQDIRTVDIEKTAVAIGSEGAGLSEKLLSMCNGQLIIPMAKGSESLNAASAASIVMWEIRRKQGC